MGLFTINANLVRDIEHLYKTATSAIKMNGNTGEWFRTTVGVSQGCLFSLAVFNSFLERLMSDALEEHDGKGSIDDKTFTNLRFADDTEGVGTRISTKSVQDIKWK